MMLVDKNVHLGEKIFSAKNGSLTTILTTVTQGLKYVSVQFVNAY